MGKADSWEMVASVVAILLGLVACASATGVQILAEDGQSSYAGMQDELKDAWKQRDEALAQVKEMEKALTSKCGAEAGANAAGAAKLAAKKEMVRKEEGIVKKEQSVARRDAQIADAAMGRAQAAAKVKNQLSDQVKKATLEMKMLQNMAKLFGKKVEQDKAAAVKADKGSTGVKAASAKESVDYGKAQDAQMKAAAAEKKVSGLQARLAAEGSCRGQVECSKKGHSKCSCESQHGDESPGGFSTETTAGGARAGAYRSNGREPAEKGGRRIAPENGCRTAQNQTCHGSCCKSQVVCRKCSQWSQSATKRQGRCCGSSTASCH